MPKSCEFCGAKERLTEHHLIPRTLHRNKWFKNRYEKTQLWATVPLCSDCHRNLHRAIPDEKELARRYNTVMALLSHPAVARFVDWRRKRVVP